jgi:transposase InsO family protein
MRGTRSVGKLAARAVPLPAAGAAVPFEAHAIRAILLISGWIGQAFELWLATLCPPGGRELAAALAANQRLRAENELLRSRLARLAPHRRPQFRRWERLEILMLRARYRLSIERTAKIFVLCPATVAHWAAELRRGVLHLVRTRRPLNALPDLIAAIVHAVKRDMPRWGTRRIAGILARLGLAGSRASVQRILRRPPPRRRIRANRATAPRRRPGILRPRAPRHMFFADFTRVRSLFRLFSITIGAVLDGFSRKVVAITAWRGEPTAKDARELLRRAIQRAGGRPRHFVTDRGTQFTARIFRRYLRRRRIRHRYGAVGCHGSIALVERFWLTLKTELLDMGVIFLPLAALRRALQRRVSWYNAERPHLGLGLRTPSEVFAGRPPRQRRVPRQGERQLLDRRDFGLNCSLPVYRVQRAG